MQCFPPSLAACCKTHELSIAKSPVKEDAHKMRMSLYCHLLVHTKHFWTSVYPALPFSCRLLSVFSFCGFLFNGSETCMKALLLVSIVDVFFIFQNSKQQFLPFFGTHKTETKHEAFNDKRTVSQSNIALLTVHAESCCDALQGTKPAHLFHLHISTPAELLYINFNTRETLDIGRMQIKWSC